MLVTPLKRFLSALFAGNGFDNKSNLFGVDTELNATATKEPIMDKKQIAAYNALLSHCESRKVSPREGFDDLRKMVVTLELPGKDEARVIGLLESATVLMSVSNAGPFVSNVICSNLRDAI